jgi:hypothetical protein
MKQEKTTHINPYKVFYQITLSFSIYYYLTKHEKIYNMRFMILIMLYDFIHVLNIKRRLSTNDGHFSKYILFTMIYLL